MRVLFFLYFRLLFGLVIHIKSFLGRFDISTTAFRCNNAECNIIREATTLEYISSGYWPGSATNTNYFFDEFLLEKWYHERHKTPGTSEQKFVEHLEEISSENQRVRSLF